MPDAPAITLQTPGAEPRRQLRYGRTEKSRQVNVGFEVEAPKGEGMKLAAVVDWRPAAGPGAGLMRRTWSVTSAKMASFPASAGAEERQIIGTIAGMFSGATGDAVATGAGHARVVRTAGPPARPQIEWMLAMAVVALPAEPVGVGAKWRVVQRGAVDGATYELDSTVELVALDVDRARLRVAGRQTEPGAGRRRRGPGAGRGPVRDAHRRRRRDRVRGFPGPLRALDRRHPRHPAGRGGCGTGPQPRASRHGHHDRSLSATLPRGAGVLAISPSPGPPASRILDCPSMGAGFCARAWISRARKRGRIGMIGQCFCGGVAFEFDGPTSNIEFCHCTRCQRATGSAFSAEFRVRTAARN